MLAGFADSLKAKKEGGTVLAVTPRVRSFCLCYLDVIKQKGLQGGSLFHNRVMSEIFSYPVLCNFSPLVYFGFVLKVADSSFTRN